MARGGPRGGGGGGGKKGGLGAIPGVAFVLTALAALVLPLWILAFLGWCVQVAGLAAVQYSQGRHFVMVRRLPLTIGPLGAALLLIGCSRSQFDWFITVFELVVLLAMPGLPCCSVHVVLESGGVQVATSGSSGGEGEDSGGVEEARGGGDGSSSGGGDDSSIGWQQHRAANRSRGWHKRVAPQRRSRSSRQRPAAAQARS